VRSAAQSYLKPECTVFCKFLSPRKVALVDAGWGCFFLRF
jgi:hypothetical protein